MTRDQINKAVENFLKEGGRIKKYEPQCAAGILLKDEMDLKEELPKEEYSSLKMDPSV